MERLHVDLFYGIEMDPEELRAAGIDPDDHVDYDTSTLPDYLHLRQVSGHSLSDVHYLLIDIRGTVNVCSQIEDYRPRGMSMTASTMVRLTEGANTEVMRDTIRRWCESVGLGLGDQEPEWILSCHRW